MFLDPLGYPKFIYSRSWLIYPLLDVLECKKCKSTCTCILFKLYSVFCFSTFPCFGWLRILKYSRLKYSVSLMMIAWKTAKLFAISFNLPPQHGRTTVSSAATDVQSFVHSRLQFKVDCFVWSFVCHTFCTMCMRTMPHNCMSYNSLSTLSWSVKNANNLPVSLTCNCHEICFNWLHMKMRLLYLKFGVMDTRESTCSETENAILYIGNGIPFTFFAFLARPVLAYRKFNTQIFNK